jgi:hypothetical protein
VGEPRRLANACERERIRNDRVDKYNNGEVEESDEYSTNDKAI